MYRKFVNARSPMRLLEKGLHGGLGIGNLGTVVAGHGTGKTSFLVGVGIDELLRGGTVLHIALDQTVGHVNDHYNAVWEALAASTHLDDAAATHSEIDSHRRIRAYRGDDFSASKLADAIKIESEAGGRPTLILIDGLDEGRLEQEEMAGIRALARELAAEVWFTLQSEGEQIDGPPARLDALGELVSVVLALEPKGNEVMLRALKDHDNKDLHDLHVSLDPTTLLLIRS